VKVTIVGGWSEEPRANEDWELNLSDPSTQKTFQQACHLIGRRLAEKRHTIVVGSDKPNSADRYVVQGFLSQFENQEASNPLIHLIQGIHSEKELFATERTSPKQRKLFLGSFSPFSGQRPRAAEKILSIKGSDALIAIGGLTDTYVAGVAALVARKPVVPIACFGGASLQLWRAVNMLGNGRDTEDFMRLSDEIWNADLVDSALRFGGLDRPRVFLGSCGKAHDIASAIRAYVESLGFNVTYWKSDFEPGEVILDEIRAASFSCKYAIFLLTPDDQIVGDDPQWVPRDNVVFEVGFFINAIGKERTLILVQEGTKVLADYGGHIYIPFSEERDVSSIAPELRRFLSSDLPQGDAANGHPNATTG